MNIKQAKAKLNEISKSTGTKHPKVLVSELCTVIKFLLDEIDRIKSPPITILPKRLPEDVKIDPPRPQPKIPGGYIPPGKTPPIYDSIKKYRKGSAGEATLYDGRC